MGLLQYKRCAPFSHDPASRSKYRELCGKEADIPLLCQDWWLDAACGMDNWSAVVVEKGRAVIGALPYHLSRGPFGLVQMVMPRLTQHHTVWIRYQDNQGYLRRISYQKKVMQSIIDRIDSMGLGYYSQHFHHSITNWLPFLWNGFMQTTRYTYILQDLSCLDRVHDGMERDKRAWIRRAGRSLSAGFDLPCRDFYRIHEAALAKRGARITYPFDLLERLFRASYERGQGRSVYCRDASGNILGALFVIWDRNNAHLLLSAFDPDYIRNGLGVFLTWEAIKLVAPLTRQCDFTGSIAETYERAFRAFGGVQTPYFNIKKIYSPLIMVLDGWGQIRKGLKSEARRLARPWGEVQEV
jgi:hypothetical protein